jgi:hypothetical protein
MLRVHLLLSMIQCIVHNNDLVQGQIQYHVLLQVLFKICRTHLSVVVPTCSPCFEYQAYTPKKSILKFKWTIISTSDTLTVVKIPLTSLFCHHFLNMLFHLRKKCPFHLLCIFNFLQITTPSIYNVWSFNKNLPFRTTFFPLKSHLSQNET